MVFVAAQTLQVAGQAQQITSVTPTIIPNSHKMLPKGMELSKGWGRQRNGVAIGMGLSKEWGRQRNGVAIGMGLSKEWDC